MFGLFRSPIEVAFSLPKNWFLLQLNSFPKPQAPPPPQNKPKQKEKQNVWLKTHLQNLHILYPTA